MIKWFIILILALLACAVSVAQAPTAGTGLSTAPATNSNPWACFPGVTLTDNIFWASQPVAVQVLRGMADPPLTQTAIGLAQQGYAIDTQIMVWGWDPVCTMGIRAADGYTWVPSLLMSPVATAPGINVPGVVPYNPNAPPSGSIKVSTDAADYPPTAVNPNPTAPPLAVVIGPCYNGGALGKVCAPGSDAPSLTNGQIVSADGVNYVAHVVVGIFGTTTWLSPQ